LSEDASFFPLLEDYAKNSNKAVLSKTTLSFFRICLASPHGQFQNWAQIFESSNRGSTVLLKEDEYYLSK
jgi:hypothetical protein